MFLSPAHTRPARQAWRRPPRRASVTRLNLFPTICCRSCSAARSRSGVTARRVFQAHAHAHARNRFRSFSRAPLRPRAGRPGHRGFRDRSTTVTMVAPACPPSASQTGERSGLRTGLAATLLALRRVVAERAAAATAPARTKLPPSRCGRRWLRVARETLALWDNVFPAHHVLARGGKRHLVSRGATRSATNCKGSAPQIFSCGRSRGGEPDTLTWCVLPHPCAGCPAPHGCPHISAPGANAGTGRRGDCFNVASGVCPVS